MARNKFPEETEKLILDVSLQLFLEKGYENTSIQDIINGLGGLSKGAIYHHFKSKDEILIRLAEQMSGEIEGRLKRVCEEPGRTGLEKLKTLFRQSVVDIKNQIVFQTAPNMMKNPRMLVLQIQSVFDEVVPDYVLPVIEEGIADGSIRTKYPRELAEVMLLLSNLWLNPLVFGEKSTLEEMIRRVEFYRELLRGVGVDPLDEDTIQQLYQAGKCYYARQSNAKQEEQ